MWSYWPRSLSTGIVNAGGSQGAAGCVGHIFRTLGYRHRIPTALTRLPRGRGRAFSPDRTPARYRCDSRRRRSERRADSGLSRGGKPQPPLTGRAVR